MRAETCPARGRAARRRGGPWRRRRGPSARRRWRGPRGRLAHPLQARLPRHCSAASGRARAAQLRWRRRRRRRRRAWLRRLESERRRGRRRRRLSAALGEGCRPAASSPRALPRLLPPGRRRRRRTRRARACRRRRAKRGRRPASPPCRAPCRAPCAACGSLSAARPALRSPTARLRHGSGKAPAKLGHLLRAPRRWKPFSSWSGWPAEERHATARAKPTAVAHARSDKLAMLQLLIWLPRARPGASEEEEAQPAQWPRPCPCPSLPPRPGCRPPSRFPPRFPRCRRAPLLLLLRRCPPRSARPRRLPRLPRPPRPPRRPPPAGRLSRLRGRPRGRGGRAPRRRPPRPAAPVGGREEAVGGRRVVPEVRRRRQGLAPPRKCLGGV